MWSFTKKTVTTNSVPRESECPDDQGKGPKQADPPKQEPTAKQASGTFRILVDGKVVYEGKSGGVTVEQKGNSVHSGGVYSSNSQVIVNGVRVSGGVTSGDRAIDVIIEGDVHGDVDAPMNVTCGDVKGDVDSGMNVTCKDVGGNVDSGMSVTCAKVQGRIDAGMNVTVLNR